MSEWEREQRRRERHEPDIFRLSELTTEIGLLLKARNIGELTTLVKQWRESEDAIRAVGAGIDRTLLIRTPEESAERELAELMEALRATRYVRMERKRLCGDPAAQGRDDTLAALAHYDFLRNVHVLKHPGCGLQRPAPERVQEAVALLDERYRGAARIELCELALHGRPPSPYVALRHGLAEDCDRYRTLNDPTHDAGPGAGREISEVRRRMLRGAERALESLGVTPPEEYLVRLDEEFHVLWSLGKRPEAIPRSREFGVLGKYGIDPESPPKEQLRRIERACRDLDRRFTAMYGRRPYAEALLADLRKTRERLETKDSTVRNDSAQRPVRTKPVARPPAQGRGRKPGL